MKAWQKKSGSYLLLMYLFKNQATLEVADADILETIKLLTRFFVRRNITDTPDTPVKRGNDRKGVHCHGWQD